MWVSQFKDQGGLTMNRRNLLSLSALTALGLALLPGNAVAQEAADVEGAKSGEQGPSMRRWR
jgi:hypothetical protein